MGFTRISAGFIIFYNRRGFFCGNGIRAVAAGFIFRTGLKISSACSFTFVGSDVHQVVQFIHGVLSDVRRLDAEMHHFTYRNFAHQIEIINHFSDVVSDGYVKAGRKPSIGQAIFHPPAKFFECYVWKLGFLDGFPGFVIAIGSAFYIFARYVKLWERGRSGE